MPIDSVLRAQLETLAGHVSDATEVEIRFLQRASGVTRVEIEHRGWERLGERGPSWRQVNLGGWNNPIGRNYLTSLVLRPDVILEWGAATGVTNNEELQHLLPEMQREVQQLGFCGVGMLMSSFGRKPLEL